MTVPHVQRCTVQQVFGTGQHRRAWQCTISPAPHPDRACSFGVDAEVYGRDLDRQRPEWLAAELRKAQAMLAHRQRRVDEVSAAASQLAAHLAFGTILPSPARRWLLANAPSAAAALGVVP